MRSALAAAGLAVISSAFVMPAWAEDPPGITASEIRIGQTMPYSGPVSAFGILGKGEVAYFKMVNDRGGINGRKVNLLSLDDSYVPPKTVEQTRRLVESDEVSFIFSTMGTAHNTAIAKYLQGKKVPQLFVASGASKFGDPQQFPLALMGVMAPFRNEARMYARYALEKKTDATFAILAQNDDFGRDYLAGLKDVLGERFDTAVTVASYEVTEPTIDSQIVKLKSTGADALIIAATPKFAAQAIRKTHEVNWHPMTFLTNVSVWVSSVMEPAGLEAGTGIISTAYVKDPLDPAWAEDPGVKGWRDYMAKYVPDGDIRDSNYVNGYNNGMVLEHVLKAAGNDLSRENILKQALSIKDLELPMLLPGIKVNTSEGDHLPVEQVQFMRFTGKQWERFGEVLSTK
ncbi:putative ABC transporter (substrate-binding protein); branched-chain amino acid transporter [Bradyrhizobium sp. ORS 285]|uniref:ABC transporter substrate-binding protein n=1 Tax=Bradyrhizobium sp. ORS 285 TaxID=115808 RepID=UPI000240B14D|nr:ABC transporter substrate-binding protein [Bradyrhizobium sp. ORS 285]CCD84765.1 putative ABC transporter (substrate-binding protein); branched-chain amino acid transporter [Bradyrhizobium sp. ORS 285]SMX60930.1 putative ABC transporter (substrate-binding protein); branched-chain amino acid transporter [Bradyrhizobium sp. ORS 285]